MISRLVSSFAVTVVLTINVGCNEAGSVQSSSLCSEAEQGTQKATEFATNKTFSTAKTAIETAFEKDSLEHAISFGKDAADNIIISAMITGNGHSSSLETVTNMFADIHNHPKGTPPSSGDLYGFISLAAENKRYETRYIITAAGLVYALVLVDLQTARNFVTKYPKVSNPGYQPGFPDSLVDESNRVKAIYSINDEMAFAYILKKYNAGVVLLKQDNSGAFQCLETKEFTNSTVLKTYSVPPIH